MSGPHDAPPEWDEALCAAALASIGLSPSRLRVLLADRRPSDAWAALAAGDHDGDPDRLLRSKATPRLLEQTADRLAGAGVDVRVLGLPGYPVVLESDPEPPAVLFAAGDLAVLSGQARVAVVGTRSASPTGRDIAREFGRALAAAGVSVVSGLARGIDTAAHDGALAAPGGAPPVGVAGTALDASGDGAQTALRNEVAARGVVLSEIPPGVGGARWRFAVRNRIMAALAAVVVVVESHERGGAFHTVSAARRRDRVVAAVPGSVRSPASAGTNALLAAGARVVRHAGDVFDLLIGATGLDPRGAPGSRDWRTRFGSPPTPDTRSRRVPSPAAARVRRALDVNPVALDVVVDRAGLPVGEVALALEQLADAGLARGEQGRWSLSRR
ncbi:MAG TPA: DNA-processing protein DprA [Acidimicrobiales bacterium]|nr:DNA-processing protein DprA [Acidimicrobiales bacterium]